ncbi:helix-turn-helix domain-containing protein [Nocardia sp. NPDC057030]|uniref:helix-turn-helix domain-containing protein n=1 Tax=unclassified Nocardia TaxID=2637762 RepID=UPI00362C0961
MTRDHTDGDVGPVLSLQVAAAQLHLNVRTIRRMISAGVLKGYKVRGTRAIRVRQDDVIALLSPISAGGEF